MIKSVFRSLCVCLPLVAAAVLPAAAQTNGDIVLHAQRASVMSGAWSLVSDATAADGLRLANPDRGAAKLATALAQPANYAEFTFTPEAGRAYRLWIRGKAENNSWANDSVFVQFSGSQNYAGSAAYRIGTTSALMVSIEEDSGAGLSGWGWQDNGYGYGVLGDLLYFDGSAQRIRLQTREDGLSIDQIVLSPVNFTTRAPGAVKNDTTIVAEAAASTSTGTISTAATTATFAWTSAVNASIAGTTLTKTKGCADCADAGATGQQTFTTGSVSFTVSSGARLVAGLGTDTSSNTSYQFNYGFSFNGTNYWEVREAGVYRTEGTFSAADVFKVAAEGSTVKYYRNGTLVYTSKVAVPGPLVVDATLVTAGAAVKVVDYTTGGTTSSTPTAPTTTTPTATTGATNFAWTSLVKTTASGATLSKTAGCGECADAGATGTQAFSAGSISFKVSSGARAVVGLGTDTSANTSYLFNYAFSFSGTNVWEVREAGVYRAEGSFAAGDVFTVSANGSVVTYSRNGAVVYTSRVAQPGALVADSTLVNLGASVTVTAFSTSGTTTTTAPPPTTTTPPPPPPPTTTTGAVTLRVLQWNTHHGGFGTDNVYNPDRVATWVAYMKPDVVMFNEIEKYTGWGNQDQPEVYKNLLQQKTGKTWYYTFAQEFGNWGSNGKGNLILSTYPLTYTTQYELVRNYDRSIALATITVNNRPITLICTHLDPYDATLRLAQAQEVTNWSAPQPENRIITGDMNAWPDQASIKHFNTLYFDSWTIAQQLGTAVAFSGNAGETKNGRIDYIFYSRGSSNLTVKSSQVYDTRDANGVLPSDHRPVLTTFEVR